MIPYVRVWHDHCMKRMPCPWTVQFVVPSVGRLEQFECYHFDLEIAPGGHMGTVPGMIDPPMLQAENVAKIYIRRSKDGPVERIS